MSRFHKAIRRLLPAVALLFTAAAVSAQAPSGEFARQSLRPYWHVFIAYTIAILLVAIWAGSIAKRLSDVESRLGE